MINKVLYHIGNFFNWLFRNIDNLLTLRSQKIYLKTFFYFGLPIGLFLPDIILFFMNGKHPINYQSIINTFIVNIIIISPLLYNYFRHINRWKKFEAKLLSFKSGEEYEITSLYNYNYFRKGESYDVIISDIYSYRHTITDGYKNYIIKNIINKFDVDDVKDKRRKKLSKLKNIYK